MIFSKLYLSTDGTTYTDTSAGNLVIVTADVPRPEMKVSKVEVLGADGAYDISDALNGYPSYSELTATFTMTSTDPATAMAYLKQYDGRKVYLAFTSGGKYLCGRMRVTADTQKNVLPVWTVALTAHPFFYAASTSSATVSAGTVTVTNGGDHAVIMTASGSGTIERDGITASLSGKLFTLPLLPGSNSFTVTGSGTLTWREETIVDLHDLV